MSATDPVRLSSSSLPSPSPSQDNLNNVDNGMQDGAVLHQNENGPGTLQQESGGLNVISRVTDPGGECLVHGLWESYKQAYGNHKALTTSATAVIIAALAAMISLGVSKIVGYFRSSGN